MTSNLSEKEVAQVLMQIHRNSESGVLTVSHGPSMKHLQFSKGMLVGATSNNSKEAFGEMLLRMGKLSVDQVDAALKVARDPNQIASAIRQLEFIGSGDLLNFQALHAQELALGLFNWTAGEFEFKPAESTTRLASDFQISIPNLVFEGIRRITHSEIVHRALGRPNRIVRLADDFEAKAAALSLSPNEGFILSRIDSSAIISEIIQISPLGIEVTQKSLYGLLAVGIIEFVVDTRDESVSKVRQTVARGDYHGVSSVSQPHGDSENDEPVLDRDLESARSDVLTMLDNVKTQNNYELLNVTAGASADEIKKSYYALAKKYHPDRFHQTSAKDLKAPLELIFSTLVRAYDTLKVPATRSSYDAKIFSLDPPESTPAQERPMATPSSNSQSPQQKLAELNYRQGRGHHEQQDYWSAIQAFRQSVRLEPENPRYRYWLAMALSKNAKWRREAEEHFLKAIEIDQFTPDYHVGLGMLYRDAGMQKRAEAQLRRALDLSPGDRNALEVLGSMEAAQSKKELKGFQSLKGLFRRK